MFAVLEVTLLVRTQGDVERKTDPLRVIADRIEREEYRL